MKIWTIYSNDDTAEGRGSLSPRLRFTSERVAREAAEHPVFLRKYGVMGFGPLTVVEEEMFESLEEALHSKV